jgi:hAT family C-terminal dimerisation region
MDWNNLGQIRTILAEFDKYTLELSTDIPQISQSLVIYYQLFDLLQEVQDREGRFVDFNMDVANAAKGAMKKYDKYYTLMDDSCDILYITMLLDPRFKKLVLEHELKDGAENIVAAMQQQLEIQYPIARHEPAPPPTSESGSAISHKTIVSEIMNKIKAKSQKSPDKSSDIARYLNSDVVEFDEKKKDWIFSWWGGHSDEYPRMAAAARDYLAVPAAEVDVERLFNSGRDLLGLRRWSLSSGTMRKLLILKDSLCK